MSRFKKYPPWRMVAQNTYLAKVLERTARELAKSPHRHDRVVAQVEERAAHHHLQQAIRALNTAIRDHDQAAWVAKQKWPAKAGQGEVVA